MASSSPNPVLFATVAVFAFVAWFAYPAPDGPEEGRILANIRWEGAVAGDARTRQFIVDEDYTRLGLAYDITIGGKIRANLTAPDGTVTESVPIDHPGDTPDELDLHVAHPAHGRWRFTVYTLDRPDAQGYLESGNFTILGFGGPRP